MITWLVGMTVLSLAWFVFCGGKMGWFGLNFKRRCLYKTFDKEKSSQLMRVLERYNNGEFLVQFSRYGDNLLFTKMDTNKNNNYSFVKQSMYVLIDSSESYTYGWIESIPHSYDMLESFNKKEQAVSNEAYTALMNLVKTLKEEPITTKRNYFGKHKNEEVHLS